MTENRYANAKRNPDYTIDQDWASYTPEEHDRWNRLFTRCRKVLTDRACGDYLNALTTLKLSESGIPDMERLSNRLQPMTGWQVVPVTDLVPDPIFFDHLANRRFPAGAFIRPEAQLDYLEEPDIFHDVFGHVPLLANPVYADFMQTYGEAGTQAAERGCLHHLARLYWYTVEFGLIQTSRGLKLFGAGIMSSTAESVFALEDPSPHRVAFNMERVMRTHYIIDDFQRTYFVIDSLQALRDAFATDFDQIYTGLASAPDIPPSEIVPGDDVISRGSQAYFRPTKAAAS